MTKNSLILVCFFLAVITCVINGCQGQQEIKKAQFFTNGQSLYSAKCENCHGAKGEGLGNLYPPLTDTAFVRSIRHELACIVKHGLHKELIVDNRTFDTEMPANPALTDQEIAYILTYVGNAFGNELGLIDTEEVSVHLKNCAAKNSARSIDR
ncbi:cytochrome c [Olivibacter sp. XZL3]|uniref:c-type cytochrome n=1 Tax=Olivibacter sp. XZL3 TaxID=1735116 RepID=UPI001065BA9A|nr:cytochrome c [Olivibacter sp. XZL3]